MFSFIKFGLLIVAALLFILESTQAFCVYNRVAEGGPSFDLYLLPKSHSSFHKNISPGGVQCCNWSEKGCNEYGGQDRIVEFKFLFGGHLKYIKCEAGGSIVFTGTSINDIIYTCTHHNGFQEQYNVIPR